MKQLAHASSSGRTADNSEDDESLDDFRAREESFIEQEEGGTI